MGGMLNAKDEDREWRMEAGEGSDKEELRVAWGRCEFKVPGSRFKVGTEMKKARITAYLRLFPLAPLIVAGAGRNFGFAIGDFGLGTAEGNKVNLELHTRSQGQSNLVKPNFMLGNLDWLKRDSEFCDWQFWIGMGRGKFQGS